jgi:hypothetical protein
LLVRSWREGKAVDSVVFNGERVECAAPIL